MINGMRGLFVGSALGAHLLLPASALTDIIGPDDPPPDRPPLVVSAQVPLYPDLLLKAKFDGEVRLRVTTDGERASTITFESGGKILFTVAEEYFMFTVCPILAFMILSLLLPVVLLP